MPHKDDQVEATGVGADELGPVEYVHHQWPAGPQQERQVRAAMRRWLLSLRLSGEQTEDILLAVSEAINNAGRHAYPPGQRGEIGLTLWTEPGVLRIDVTDHGQWHEPAGGQVGRGIMLMRSLVDSVAITVGRNGTRVSFRHRLPADVHTVESGGADRDRIDSPGAGEPTWRQSPPG